MSTQAQFEAADRFPTGTAAGVDHKAWARRILFREERKDKTLLSIQVRFAREALDVRAEVPA